MRGINQVHYVGSLTQAPDMKYTPGGLAILELTVAGKHDIITSGGETKQVSFYNRCKAFGAYAEALAESFAQGDVVSLHGRLDYRSYEVEGERRSTVETVIETIQTLDAKFVLEDDRRAQPILVGGLNSVTIGGNLTKDADHRQLATGLCVAHLAVAVNEHTGKEERIGYFDLNAWGELADALAEGTKGRGIIGVGRLVSESWEDRQGNKRYGTKVELERAYFVAPGTAKHVAPAKNTQKPQRAAPQPNSAEEFPPEASLPF